MNNEIQQAAAIGNGFMSSNKIITNIFSIEMAEPVKIEHLGEKYEGNLDSIKWAELKKIGVEISKLLTDTFEFIDMNIGVKQYYRLQENKYYFGISIGLLNVELDQEKCEQIQGAGMLLVNNMVDNSNGAEPEVVFGDLSEQQIQQIGEQSDKFLQKCGGSKIRTPIVIVGSNFTIKCAGKFKEKPSVKIFAPISEKIYGKIDAISLHARKFEVIEHEKGAKLSVLFDMNNHFEKLKSLLGNDFENEFTIQKELDGKGVAVNTLLTINLDE